MRKLPFILLLSLLAIAGFTACNSDDDSDTWSEYKDWREENNAYFISQRDSLGADGKLFYEMIYPSWNPGAQILIHYFNDRQETAENLQPMLTSTCSVIYHASLKNGVAVDSSYANTNSIANFRPDQVVQGFAVALMNMHVGDSCEILVPYALGYGGVRRGEILPYSTLRFNIRLKDIPAYEIR